ncbi:MAG: transposase [Chloroflexi bacterium]|nr:transposase [Chloroflexota bacterium]
MATALGPSDPDDGDIGRQQRGLAIAALSTVKKTKVGYKVLSQSGNGTYAVRLDGEYGPACECPDFDTRNAKCKHIYAVELYQMREEDPATSPEWTDMAQEAEPVKKPTYSQDWPAYNAAQKNEKRDFGRLLRDLCDVIEQPAQGRGRPRMPMSDMVFAVTTKVYLLMSARRIMPDIEDATEKGQMDRAPSSTSIWRYLEKPELTPILKSLVEQSALPLKDLEDDFAADSSGFGTSVYDRHFEDKWGGNAGEEGRQYNPPHKRSKYLMAHVACGVRTNIITAAVVRTDRRHDSVFFPELVETTARNFTIREFSADKAYSTKDNLVAVLAAGGTPLIPFKKDANPNTGHHKKDPVRDNLWALMYHYFHLRRKAFNDRYHKRSNVESCFHMMKSQFGGFVRSKTPTAQVNEVYAKILCHNIVVLVKMMYKLKIDPTFGLSEEQVELPMAA